MECASLRVTVTTPQKGSVEFQGGFVFCHFEHKKSERWSGKGEGMKILQSWHLKREHWAGELSAFPKGQSCIIRPKGQGALPSSKGSLLVRVNRK